VSGFRTFKDGFQAAQGLKAQAARIVRPTFPATPKEITMNPSPNAGFEPSSPLLRKTFAVIAVAATFATAYFIDALAHGYGTSAPLAVQARPIVVAQR
jgi:hypothetical protein